MESSSSSSSSSYLCLHLNREPEEGTSSLVDASATHQRTEHLHSISILLWHVLSRSEARLWFCADIGSLQKHIPRPSQASIFLDLLRPPPDHPGDYDELLCRQTLRLACQTQPRNVMRLFMKDSKFIRQFFSGHPKRILGWFENFSNSLKKDKQLGAQALAHFAFIHRDRYWKELEWKGSHGQAPAVVASKPHYFLDLDVLRTVENFLDYIPEFWRSDELWDSLKEGDIISLDMNHFVDKLFQWLRDGSLDVWEMLKCFLSEEAFSVLCQHLLSFLRDEKLLGFVNNLRLALSQKTINHLRQQERIPDSDWLMAVLIKGEACPSLECVMLCNACIMHSRQILHMLRDEENFQAYDSLKSLAQKLKCSRKCCAKDLWHYQWQSSDVSKWEIVKRLALELICVRILISEEYTSSASIEILLSANHISFSHGTGGEAKRNRKEWKKKRKRKNKRRSNGWSDVQGLDSSQSDGYDEELSLSGAEEKWNLVHGNFTMVMAKDEIPERISSYVFQEWLRKLIMTW